MPEFGPGGRQVLFGEGWNSGVFRHHRTGIGWSPWILIGLVGALAMAVILGARRLLAYPVIVLGATGLILWLAARITLFDLYLPNRHSRYSLAAVLIATAVAAGYAAFKTVLRLANHGNSALPGWLTGAICIATPVAVVFALAPDARANFTQPVDQNREQVYAFLQTLPKDTLIAAHPNLADYIPLRSKRSVLASTEGWIAFKLGYHARMTPRIEASLRAAYASDWPSLQAPLSPYGVDVFVSSDSVFAETGYNPPFDALAADLLQAGEKDGFIMQNPPAGSVIFQSGPYVVVAVNDNNTLHNFRVEP